MKHRDEPYRQCMTCRRIFPKGQLLRFVKDHSGGAVFDERQTMDGRGYYLCPAQGCFVGAWKNKRARTILIDESAGELLSKVVTTMLLNEVDSLLSKEHRISPYVRNGELDAETGVILLAREGKESRPFEELRKAARERGVLVLIVPRTVLRGEDHAVITKKSPKISPILRNLRFYERLSSKGRSQ